MAASDGVSSNLDKLGWWKKHEADLPHCQEHACKVVLLIQPSSVAAERLFSLVSNSFSDTHVDRPAVWRTVSKH